MGISIKKKKLFLCGCCAGGVLVLAGGFIALKYSRKASSPKRFITTQIRELYPKLEGIRIFTASSLDRIFPDGHTLVKPNFGKDALLTLARHEYESFQIILETGPQPVKNVSFNISDFKHSQSEAQLNIKNISIREVGFVPTIKPYYPVKHVGLWPDPLMPLIGPVDLKPDRIQPFWVTVYMPKDAMPGKYIGNIKVTADGITPREIPVTIEVYDFELPIEGHLKTSFDFYGHITKARYRQGNNENDNTYEERIGTLNYKYITALLKYRLNPVLNVDPSNEYDLGAVDRYLPLGLNNFSIGKRGGTFNNNWPSSDSEVESLLMTYRTYGEMLKLNRLLEYTYIYTWDEGDIGNPLVAKLTSMIHKAYPGLKNMVCYHGFWNPDENPEWGKDIDIWTFQIDTFNEEKLRKLQNKGIEVWTYPSGPSGQTLPNYVIDFDSIDYRILPWLAWKYNIKGILYWCVNWWPNVDPFMSAKNTKWQQNGNGLLFYPGEDGPIASLRLEIIRDGMEDYEYIHMLSDKIKELKKLNKKAEDVPNEAGILLIVDSSIAEHMMKYNREEGSLKKRRNEIAREIEKINKLIYLNQTNY